MEKLANKRVVWIASIVAGVLGAIIAIALFGKPLYHISAFDVRVAAVPAFRGETRISIPPLGSVIAKTHVGPMAIKVGIEEASIDDLRSVLIKRHNEQGFMARIKKDAERAAINFGIRLLLLAFFGGMSAVIVLRIGRKLRFAIIGGVAGAVFIAINITVALATYNTNAFKNPQMTNALRATPWVVRLLHDGIVKIDELDEKLEMAASSIYKVENTLGGIVSTGDDSEQMRILAISDLHNNTFGMSFADDLAKLFDVDLVLNAGDLTDLGTGYENGIAEQATRFNAPQVFVAGNHDSIETLAGLRKTHKVIFPHERVVEVAGLRILGQHDPVSREIGPRRVLATPQQIAKARHRLMMVLKHLSKPPDILLVHEPEVASVFVGKVPIIVSGHDHVLAADRINGTAWIRPGSTGASGIRYFIEGNNNKAITAAIIYVARYPKPRAVAVDLIAVTNSNGEFTVRRMNFPAGNLMPKIK